MKNRTEVGYGDIVGAVCSQNSWRLYAAPLGVWILDYASYAPNDPGLHTFRDGLSQVRPSDALKFLDLLSEHEITPAVAKALAATGEDAWGISVLVNFDSRTFLSSYFDLALEAYSGPEWAARFEDSLKEFLPHSLRLAIGL